MTDNQKEVYRPGAIKLEGIQLYNFKKNSVLLTDSMIEFTIFQDLYGKGTKIELSIVDLSMSDEQVFA